MSSSQLRVWGLGFLGSGVRWRTLELGNAEAKVLGFRGLGFGLKV